MEMSRSRISVSLSLIILSIMLIKPLLRQENMKTIEERHVAVNMCNVILYNVNYAED